MKEDIILKKIEKIENRLTKIESSSASKRDLNYLKINLETILSKLHKKLTDMNNTIKNKLIYISKHSKKRSDEDIAEQLKLVSEPEE